MQDVRVLYRQRYSRHTWSSGNFFQRQSAVTYIKDYRESLLKCDILILGIFYPKRPLHAP